MAPGRRPTCVGCACRRHFTHGPLLGRESSRKDEHFTDVVSASAARTKTISPQRLRSKSERYFTEYLWIESDHLEPLRFYRLYQAPNNSQFSSKADQRDDVERFRCDTQFTT